MLKLGEKYKIILFAALMLLIVVYAVQIWGFSAQVVRALVPVFFGLVFALTLNPLINLFERKIFKKIKKPQIKRAFSLTLTCVIVLGFIAALCAFIFPQIVKSLYALADKLPEYIEAAPTTLDSIAKSIKLPKSIYSSLRISLDNASRGVSKRLVSFLPVIYEFSKNLLRKLIEVIFGFVLGVFILARRENLIRNFKKTLNALFNQKTADYIFNIVTVSNTKLSAFLGAQTIECIILGVMCFIVMTIFRMPFAPLISVIIGITNFIPIIGPLIGLIPSALILLMVNPMTAVYFVIMVLVLQVIESNLIYPKVVGKKLGISDLFVLIAVTVFGGLFGIGGMLIGVPLFACFHALFKEFVSQRLEKKQSDKLARKKDLL